jgi:TrpR-related protein YerC/YecD
MDWNSNQKQNLVKAILSLKTKDETESFLRDLLTPSEIEEFTKRLEAAQMLADGFSYSVVEKKTGFSSTTVARVSKWLNNGEGGYKTIIDRLHHHAFTPNKKRVALM